MQTEIHCASDTGGIIGVDTIPGLKVQFYKSRLIRLRVLASYIQEESQTQEFITCEITLSWGPVVILTLSPHSTKEIDLGPMQVSAGQHMTASATSAPSGTANEGKVCFTVFVTED